MRINHIHGWWVLGATALALAATPARAEDPATPQAVAIAIDTSGSLRPADLKAAQDLAAGLAAALPGATFLVLAFDDDSRVVQGWTSDPAQVRGAIAGLRRSGRHTALHDALFDASRLVAEMPATRRAVVVLTDGLDEDSALELMDGLSVARQARVPVHTVGVGRVQERVLRRIAKLTGGGYRRLAGTRPRDLALAIASATPAAVAAAPANGEGPDAVAAATARREARGGAGVRGASPPAAAGAAAPARGRTMLVAGTAVLALLLLAGGLVLLRSRRAGAGPETRCPTCGRALANPLSRCPVCPPPDATARTTHVKALPPPGAPAPETPEAYSDTVLEKMNVTEEFLEKTVTLRERPVLTIVRGPDSGRVFDLTPAAALSIGRAKANDVVLNDVAVSSEHCRVRPEEGRFVVHDLKSTNGTWVNERRVTRHVLEEGDVVKVGETSLQFRKDLRRQ